MRTTVDLPADLIEDVARLTGSKKKKDALRIALEEYVRNKRVEALLASAGTMPIDYVRPEMERAELAASESESKVVVKVAEPRSRYR